MNEAQSLGVQGLAGTKFETVLDELLVLGINGSLTDFRTSISLVVEERMTDMAHMDPYLMGSASFQLAFHNSHEAETLQYPVMGYRALALLRVVIDSETEAVIGVSANIAVNGAIILFYIAPNHCDIASFDGVLKELARKPELGFVILGNYQQA